MLIAKTIDLQASCSWPKKNHSIQLLPFQATALVPHGVVVQISHTLSGMISSHSFFKARVRAPKFLQLCNLGNFQSKLCNKKYKNVAVLTCSWKKEWDEITLTSCAIFVLPHYSASRLQSRMVKAILNNFFGHSELTYKSIVFAVNIIFLHP